MWQITNSFLATTLSMRNNAIEIREIDIKTLWFEFGYDSFTGFKMPTL